MGFVYDVSGSEVFRKDSRTHTTRGTSSDPPMSILVLVRMVGKEGFAWELVPCVLTLNVDVALPLSTRCGPVTV